MKMSGRLKLLFVCAVLIGLVLAAFGPQAVFATENDEASLQAAAEAKSKAIIDAIQAIASIQNVQYLGLHHKAEVELARMLVDIAIEEHGASESEITNLAKLLEAEYIIERLTAIQAAKDAIDAIPPLDELTWADKALVEEARRLVEIARTEYNATDFELCWRLRVLAEAEDKIDDMDEPDPEPTPPPPPADDRPMPPTGGMLTYLPAGMLALGLGLLAVNRRMRK